MPRSFDMESAPFRQMYFAAPSDLADRFKMKCLSERKTMKDVMLQLIREYTDGKGKAK